MEFLKKNKKFVAWALLVTLVLIPLFIQVLINWDTMNNGSDDGWLGFWGGYLGSIIGVVGALIVIQIQLSNDKERFDKETKAKNKELAEDKKRFELQILARDKELEEERKAIKSEQVDNTFFNLLLLFNDQKNTLLKDNNHFEELRESIFDNSVLELRRMGIDKLYESSDELISILENMIKEFDIDFNSRKTQYS